MFIDKKTQYCQHVTSLQLIYRLNAITIKILASYFVDNDKWALKFIVNTILKERDNIKGLTLTDFKNYHEAMGWCR